MAIQTINLTVPGGDTPRSANTKINANFTDQTHAASKLIGTENGKIPLSENIGKLSLSPLSFEKMTPISEVKDFNDIEIGTNHFISSNNSINTPFDGAGASYQVLYTMPLGLDALTAQRALQISVATETARQGSVHFRIKGSNPSTYNQWWKIYHSGNTTIVNGSLKPSSPVVKIHTDSLELNDDAERMGVTLNKRGVGDYLLQNTTGLRNDGGWRIELPQDVNGNPYFAVDYNELENNDIEVKTYKRIFDMNTFMFVPDLDNPVDIKEGRSIAIRFNDLPLDDIAGSPAQTNNP